MTDAILFPKVIYQKLQESTELKKYVSERLFPLVTELKTKTNFIVYKRESITTVNETKDGYSEDLVTFTIWVVSDKYITSLEIANIVRHIFNHRKLKNDYFICEDCKMTDIREDFEENAYLQVLNFEVTVKNM